MKEHNAFRSHKMRKICSIYWNCMLPNSMTAARTLATDNIKTTVPYHISAGWLRQKQACPSQVMAFAKLWPKGVNIRPDNVRTAYDHDLDVYWFACRILTDAQRHEWDEQYARKCQAWAEKTNEVRGEQYHNSVKRITALRGQLLPESIIAILWPGREKEIEFPVLEREGDS